MLTDLGWSIDRILTKPIQRNKDEKTISIPLEIKLNGRRAGDTKLKLPLAQAEQVDAQLCRLLDGYGPHGTPSCLDPHSPFVMRTGI